MVDNGQLQADWTTTWEMEFRVVLFRYFPQTTSAFIYVCFWHFIISFTWWSIGLSKIMDSLIHAIGQCGNVEHQIRELGSAVLRPAILPPRLFTCQFMERWVSNSKGCSSLWSCIWTQDSPTIRNELNQPREGDWSIVVVSVMKSCDKSFLKGKVAEAALTLSTSLFYFSFHFRIIYEIIGCSMRRKVISIHFVILNSWGSCFHLFIHFLLSDLRGMSWCLFKALKYAQLSIHWCDGKFTKKQWDNNIDILNTITFKNYIDLRNDILNFIPD